MGLTGLEIYKQLPKTNCGECGPPTCLAFAMALAAGKASLDSCPHVTEAAKETLGAAAAPPIKLVKVGTGDKVVQLGDETVIFRHDKTFFHPTGIAFAVDDTEDVAGKVATINDLKFERVGLQYDVDMVAVKYVSGNPDTYKAAVQTVAANTSLAIVLLAGDAAAAEKALEVCGDKKPLIYAAKMDNYEKMVELAKKYSAPLAVYAEGLDALAELVEKVVALGYKELVLDPGARTMQAAIADFTQIRRLAIKKKFRPLGYPIIAFTTAADPLEEALEAQVYISKYASMLVLKSTDKAIILPLLTWRQNLYTDPQKPVAVEAGVHVVGEVGPDSPVYVTTNFSLTYYCVEPEVEGTKIPSYIIAVDTDGTSVMTAWAAGKFVAETIAEYLPKCGIADKVNHKKLIIPGGVAAISGKLQELSGWEVIVGPRDASQIGGFAKVKLS